VSVPGAGATALVVAVRAGPQAGFDRVVLEFSGPAAPGYAVGYVDQPVQDASGRAATVAGTATLEVRTSPASGVDISPAGVRTTYAGPERIRPAGTAVVQELARAGDFEGTLTWVVGTSRPVPFKVSTLSSPPRVVVDLRTP
jgi:hypothetical protein